MAGRYAIMFGHIVILEAGLSTGSRAAQLCLARERAGVGNGGGWGGKVVHGRGPRGSGGLGVAMEVVANDRAVGSQVPDHEIPHGVV